MSDESDRLADSFRRFAEASFADAPLYMAVSLAVADDEEVMTRISESPVASHWPLPLLASVHYLLLGNPEDPLALVYRQESDADPVPLFLAFVHEHWDELLQLMINRYIQTNECGRTALLAPAFTLVESGASRPLAWIDVGTSAGLLQLVPHYRLDYGEHGTTGPEGSPVVATCEIVGEPPVIAKRTPAFSHILGLDRAPVDIGDPEEARWLLACVWPASPRLARTAAAIELAKVHPPHSVKGDAVNDLAALIATVPEESLVVLTTTWVVAYFDTETRQAFMDLLKAVSMQRPLVLVSLEAPGVIATIDQEPDVTPSTYNVDNHVGLTVFQQGTSTPHFLGFAHPHGAWLEWRGPAGISLP